MNQDTELQKLKSVNAELKSEISRLQSKKTRPRVFRTAIIFLLVGLSAVLLAVGNVAFWFGNTIVKPDRFTAATQPIIKDPAVDNALALYTTNSIFSNIDVENITESVLPPKASFLAPQLTNQLKDLTKNTVYKIASNPDFQSKWNEILANQHQRLIGFASTYQGDGDISLNDVYKQLVAGLAGTKLAFLSDKNLPSSVGNIEIVSAPWLPKFHNLITNIDTWRNLAVLVMGLFLATAVALSKNRRRVIYAFSFAAAGLMLLSLMLMRIASQTIVQKADPQYSEGVRHAINIFGQPLVSQTLLLFFIVCFVGALSWLSGSSPPALAIKNKVSLIFSGSLHSKIFSRENTFTAWVARYKRPLEWGAVGLISLLMLSVSLTIGAFLVYMLVLLILVLLIELVASQINIL